MSLALPKQGSNITLALLGLLALGHSIFFYGTGTLPEAILAGLFFLNAFTDRRQSLSVAGVGVLAVAITWTVNSNLLASGFVKTTLSWFGILLFAVLAFSRKLLQRPENTGTDVEIGDKRN